MIAALALAAIAQAAPQQPSLVPACSLVTPRGDNVGFQMLASGDRAEQLALVPSSGSVWPSRTLVGRKGGKGGKRGAESTFLFGGSDGVAIRASVSAANQDWQPIALYRRAGRQIGLPLAFGFCQSGGAPTIHRSFDMSAGSGAIEADIPAFDPDNWPDDCTLLTRAGRRTRVSFSLEGPNKVEISSPQSGPWPQKIVVDRRPSTFRLASFGGGDGPAGQDMFFVHGKPPRAMRLVQFHRLGAGGAPDGPGFAICGYRNVTMKPSFR